MSESQRDRLGFIYFSDPTAPDTYGVVVFPWLTELTGAMVPTGGLCSRSITFLRTC